MSGELISDKKVLHYLKKCAYLYSETVQNIDTEAAEQDGRAYGGMVRMGKGKMVEEISRNLLKAAWLTLGKKEEQIKFVNKKYEIPMRSDYPQRVKNEYVREYILANSERFKIHHGTDIHVFLDGTFMVSVECKSYTENAMLKRILVDAYLLRTIFPELRFVLIQLESQLGGDYSNLGKVTIGSPQSHTLMSYFDIELTIITLLEGERMVKREIHKPGFYKPMKMLHLEKAALTLASVLDPNLKI